MTESAGIRRIEEALARLGSEHEPPADWQVRVLTAVATERLEGALGQLGDGVEPPVGWQARVLAAAEEHERPRRRWWMFAIPIAAVAAAAVIAIVVTRPKPSEPFELALRTDKTGPVVRGATATLGDTLHAAARGGDAQRAVWVYRGDHELVIACPGGAGCRSTDTETTADVELRVPGTYTIVAVSGPAPLPTGSLDDDLAAALRAKAEYTSLPLDVR